MKKTTNQSKYNEIAINSFLRLMMHEVRTPLNAIVGGVNLFTKSYTEQNGVSLDFIHSGVSRLLNLMDIVTEIAQLKSKDYEMLPVLIDIKLLIERLETEINGSLEKSDKPKISIQYSINNSYQLIFDIEIIFKLLFILCNNILYSCTNPKIRISFSGENRKNVIKVQEIEKGIPKEKVLEIYNSKRCLNSSSSTLYTCEERAIYHVLLNEILNHINAEIEIDNKHPKGAIFQINIPVT